MCRIFGDKFPRRVNKNGSFRVRYLLDSLSLAIVKVCANDNVVYVFDLGLLIVAVECELSALGVGYQVAVEIKDEALSG